MTDRRSNLLKETLNTLERGGKKPSDVSWVGVLGSGHERSSAVPVGSWADFAKFADFNYDAGYGGNEVAGRLVIVGEDWWLERGEYDGSEWWEFKSLPKRPDDMTPLRDTDLRES